MIIIAEYVLIFLLPIIMPLVAMVILKNKSSTGAA